MFLPDFFTVLAAPFLYPFIVTSVAAPEVATPET